MLNTETKKQKSFYAQEEKRMPLPQQILYQILCLLIGFTVIFPVLWIVSISLDPRNISRPKEFTLIPPGASLNAYQRVLDKPTANPVTFAELAKNQLALAAGTSIFSVGVGILAAYSFSRFNYWGRKGLMLGVVTVLMLPSIATIAPLFVLLNRFQIDIGGTVFNLRNSLLGVGIAIAAGQLPFAIWNLKGYLDTIPKELEEAAFIDGATPNQMFIQIVLPLAMPAIAVTGFLAFITSWTEFAYSWMFLNNPKDFTLAMSLWSMVGQFSGDTPWSVFAAMALMVALPVAVIYLFLQKYIVGGLVIGGVK
jgi:arabinogalactan oligomer/maltooligosaccharide transport system permease protein